MQLSVAAACVKPSLCESLYRSKPRLDQSAMQPFTYLGSEHAWACNGLAISVSFHENTSRYLKIAILVVKKQKRL